MWVYLRTEENVWTVGFFAPPDNKWITESDHPDPESAAQRVHWLNGGAGKASPVTLLEGKEDAR